MKAPRPVLYLHYEQILNLYVIDLLTKPIVLMKSLIYILILLSCFSYSAIAQPVVYTPSLNPDRILLNWSGDPATTATVTWRTSAEAVGSKAEIALADPHPDFDENETDYQAETQLVEHEDHQFAYHRVTFRGLRPNTLYAYRVGNDAHRSAWLQFKTAGTGEDTLSFIFLGDAQNRLLDKWSRAVRAAYRDMPDAAFMLHAGDLINHADEDKEWGEWFEAGSFIHSTIPSLSAVGNHEYIKNEAGEKVAFSKFWDPQFHFPANGPAGMENRVYYLDIQQIRLVVLNSNKNIKQQAAWLEEVLKTNPKKWLIVSFHHPIYSVSRGAINEGIYQHWKPLLEKYKVDLVLQGHDHIYGRTRGEKPTAGRHRPVYVVSVSGPKMYDRHPEALPMDVIVEKQQLYQTLHIAGDRLVYRAKSVDAKLVDSFELQKTPDGNILTSAFEK